MDRRTPRQRRSRETVEVILIAAAQLFERDGYATTTNHIAERAGVSVGTLYQYFPNKESLVSALVKRHMTEMVTALGALLDACRPGDLRELLQLVVGAAAQAHLERPALHRFLFERAPRTEEVISQFRALEHELARALAAELRRLDVAAADPEALALLAVQGIDAQLHGALLDGDRLGSERRLALIVELWERALA